jgi:hypothetical protein
MFEKFLSKNTEQTDPLAELRRIAILTTETLNQLSEVIDRADARSTAMKAQGGNLPRISFGL